jgi:FMN-dependent oxidoreductase (nitrilotriacetate monooxygenase family)
MTETSGAPPERMRFGWFMSYFPAGIPLTMWHHPANRAFDYLDAGSWASIARLLEASKVDCLFLADQTALHSAYLGPDDVHEWDSALRYAAQAPVMDVSYLLPIISGATEKLGVVFSSNVIAHHPYVFARALTTLDHITQGRVGWNIVTSFQEQAWRNLGYGALGEHADRYALAEEYVEVVYRLLEGSWEDDAVQRDRERRVYADPRKVHAIDPVKGTFDHVLGPHMAEPSLQRVPLLFQAGSSDDGRAFAARHAEGIFQTAANAAGGRKFAQDVGARLASSGRAPGDAMTWQSFTVIFGGTEEEAQRRDREFLEYFDEEHYKAYFSSTLKVDLGSVDLDRPIGDLKTSAAQGRLKQLIESIPNKSWTFRDYVMGGYSRRFVGTGEQFADYLEQWRDAGVLGVNLSPLTGVQELEVFAEAVAPVLQKRGLMQSEYHPGATLRERIFDGHLGPRLNDRHPAARHRFAASRGPSR